MKIMKININKNLDEIPECVLEELSQIGVPSNISGFYYLCTAITRVAKDLSMIDHVCKDVYPSVAKAYGTTGSRVERSIRHAISVVFNRNHSESLGTMFSHRRPTNSEFIARIALKLRKSIES